MTEESDDGAVQDRLTLSGCYCNFIMKNVRAGERPGMLIVGW